jgi:membrane associated rhomboid family serine protease
VVARPEAAGVIAIPFSRAVPRRGAAVPVPGGTCDKRPERPVIPLRDVIPTRTFPAVTVLVIAVSLLVFLFQLTLGESERTQLVRQLGLVPAAVTWWHAITSLFVHAGWLHVSSNLLVLWLFGEGVEDRMGHGRFLLFYLLGGVLALLAHVAFDPRSAIPAVGSSGAVAAVMGAYFRLYRRSRVLTLVPVLLVVQIVEVPALFFLGAWLLVQLLAGPGVAPGTTYPGAAGGLSPVALLAGFAAGALLVLIFRRPERLRVEWWGERR